MARRLPSSPPVLPGFTYVTVLGSGGFADVFLYEQDMPPPGRREGDARGDRHRPPARHVPRGGRPHGAAERAPVRAHGAPGVRRRRRPPVPRDGAVLVEPQRPVPPRAARRRGGAARGDPHRERRGDRPPRGRAAPRHQAREHPHDRVRAPRAQRLRHRLHARGRRGDRRGGPLHPVVGARGARRREPRHGAERGVVARRDRVLAARRPQPVRGARRAERARGPRGADPAGAAPAHRARRRARAARARAAPRHVAAAGGPARVGARVRA